MKVALTPILFLAILLAFTGCNKDQEIADLESEVMESEAIDYLADSVVEEAVTPPEDELAMTPEKTPEEEIEPQLEMPIRMETDGYTVQVSSSTSYENTYTLVELYSGRGYEAYVTQTVLNGETYYRIRIGVYETFEQAQELALELKDKYSITYWITAN